MNKPAAYAIIVAAGSGKRAATSIPKQFVEVLGLPLVMHTLKAFYDYSEKLTTILVLPEDQIDFWNALCVKHNFRQPDKVVKGGEFRSDSVRNGLATIEGGGLVAVHDGARPLVTTDLIATSFKIAAVHKTAIAAVRPKESLRMVSGDTSTAADRDAFRIIQTPQTFDVDLLKEAYALCTDRSMTDDASVVEQMGKPVFLFDGRYDNIKVTTPEDLVIAATLLNARTA